MGANFASLFLFKIFTFCRNFSKCYNIYGTFSNELSLQGPYYAFCDTAFGAKKDRGQKVVFLGALNDIPFKRKGDLKVEIHDLDWSTSPLTEEQVLAMREEDLLLAVRKNTEKDLDAKDDAKTKNSKPRRTQR